MPKQPAKLVLLDAVTNTGAQIVEKFSWSKSRINMNSLEQAEALYAALPRLGQREVIIDSIQKHLEAFASDLQSRLAKVEEINRRACEDWADDDTRVKELAKPFFTELQINGDGNWVGVIDIAELFATRLAKVEEEKRELLEAASDLLDYDNENQCPVCHCCNMELSDKGTGHKLSCLAYKILSQHTPAAKALDKAALAKGEAKPSEDRQ
jgi:hypothetical protein